MVIEAIAQIKSGGALQVLTNMKTWELELQKEPPRRFTEGLCYAYLGQPLEAIAIWTKLIAEGYWSRELVLQAARCQLCLGQPLFAREILEIDGVQLYQAPTSELFKLWCDSFFHPANKEPLDPLLSFLRAVDRPLSKQETLILIRALVVSGDTLGALQIFSDELPCPLMPDLSALAHFLKSESAIVEAIAVLRCLVATGQATIEHEIELINLEHMSGDIDRLDHTLADAVERYPESLEIIKIIVRHSLRESRLHVAALWFARLEALVPEDMTTELRPLAALVQLKFDDLQSVEMTINEIEESDQSYDEVRVEFFSKINNPLLARQYQDRLLNNSRRSIASVMSSARLSLQVGDTSDALSKAYEVLAQVPQHLGAVTVIVDTHGKNTELRWIQILQAAVLDHKTCASHKSWISHCLADYYHSSQNYALASRLYEESNFLAAKVKNNPYNRNEHSKQCTNIKKLFRSEELPRLPRSNQANSQPCVPVFIVGVPRSGTTLTEQMLAKHSHCIGMGERPYIQHSLSWLNNAYPAVSAQDFLRSCSSRQLEGMRNSYYGLLEPHYRDYRGGGRPFLIDKLPDNYMHIGWIRLLLPEAKIIYAYRDPREIALSCWRANFGAINWAFDQEDIGARIIEHQRLMSVWMEIYEDAIFPSTYEDLVRSPRTQIHNILNFLGLSWEARCLDHADNSSVVATASIRQVRREVFQSSLGSWTKYKDALRPVLDMLE